MVSIKFLRGSGIAFQVVKALTGDQEFTGFSKTQIYEGQSQ